MKESATRRIDRHRELRVFDPLALRAGGRVAGTLQEVTGLYSRGGRGFAPRLPRAGESSTAVAVRPGFRPGLNFDAAGSVFSRQTSPQSL